MRMFFGVIWKDEEWRKLEIKPTGKQTYQPIHKKVQNNVSLHKELILHAISNEKCHLDLNVSERKVTLQIYEHFHKHFKSNFSLFTKWMTLYIKIHVIKPLFPCTEDVGEAQCNLNPSIYGSRYTLPNVLLFAILWASKIFLNVKSFNGYFIIFFIINRMSL